MTEDEARQVVLEVGEKLERAGSRNADLNREEVLGLAAQLRLAMELLKKE